MKRKLPDEKQRISLNLNRLPFLILLSALAFSACAPRPQDCARADVFCAGLVTASGTIDDGINQEAWLGLQDAKAEGLVNRIDYIETVDSRDRARNIAVFADQGYDVIITVGFSIADETVASAQQYPLIKFVGVEQPQATKYPNLAGLVFHEERSGFLAGALAAMITKTNHVAAVCEEKFLDSMRRYCDGFQAGARYANPKIKTDVVYRTGASENLFNDPDWGSAAALKLVNGGADVLFAAGGSTGDAALESAAEQGAAIIGTETDTYSRLADVRPKIVTSALNGIRSGVLDLMRLTRSGEFPSGEFFGQVELAPFRDWDYLIPESVKEKLNKILQGLENKSIQTSVPYKSP
ncbi:MAG: BMP family ABC transporter substrate-binding protein [Chloroflexi bacterium]|nr:BMP family ABC transporter substrate-binding protein [Chloroflexota bacterium]